MSTGTFYSDVTENADFVKKINDTGVKAVVLTPFVMVEKEEMDSELLNSYKGIMNQSSNMPLGMYECPSPYSQKSVLKCWTSSKKQEVSYTLETLPAMQLWSSRRLR